LLLISNTFKEWLNYEEIDDAEIREKQKYEENEEENAENNEESELGTEKPKKPIIPVEDKIISLPVSAGDAQCAVCRERFQTFFEQEDEEWHYEDVVKDESSRK
jgi:hypothetical protein